MKKENIGIIIFINVLFFQVGLLMSMMSALIPEIIDTFRISYGLASILPFAFYIALSISCIPAGIAGERFSARNILMLAFVVAFLGILVFVLSLSYLGSVVSLFIIGISVAIVQVISVPLLRRACGPENLALHSTLNQLMYGVGAFASPVLYAVFSEPRHEDHMISKTLHSLVPAGFEWVSAYWLFLFLLILLIIGVLKLKFPAEDKTRKKENANRAAYLELIKNKYVWLYFIVLVAYASCEQGIAAWMTKYLQDFHGIDPQKEGASILSIYWLLLTVGCFAGMILLRFFDSRKVLGGMAFMAIVSLFSALYGSTDVAKILFPTVAVFLSVMWPIILSLALNSVKKYHETLSGLMFTASLGGALGPVVIGTLGDQLGLSLSMHYLFLPLALIFSVPFWGKPLVVNRTYKLQKAKG